MTFVEQGVKQPMLSCFLAEHEHLSKGSKITSPIVEESLHGECNNKVQDLFIVEKDARRHIDQAVGSDLQLAVSPAIPHWMNSNQELELKISTTSKNGFTANMAISKPQIVEQKLDSHSQDSLKSCDIFSFPSIGIVSEQRNGSSSASMSTLDASKSLHLFHKQLPPRSSLSAGLKPSQAPVRGEQREDPKVDLVSFLLQKQRRQVIKECPKALPSFPHGHSGEKPSDQKSQVSSWVSRFPFQIGGEANLEQSWERRGWSSGHSTYAGPNKEHSATNVCPSQLVDSKVQADHPNCLIQHSSSPMEVAKSMLSQETQASLAGLPSMWALSNTLPGSNMPSLKRDWNATMVQSVKHPQILPDFFAQQKLTAASNATLFAKGERLPEMPWKKLFPHDRDSLRKNGGEIIDRNRNSLVGHQYMTQHGLDCRMEAWRQPSHNSSLQVDILKVKLETSSEDLEASKCGKSISMDSMGRNYGTGIFKGNFSSTANQAAKQPSCVAVDLNKAISNSQATELMLFAECASTHIHANSSNVSASVPPLSFMKQPHSSRALQSGKTVVEGDWGEFLAGSKATQAAGINAKTSLPFQQRFEQLQEFLRKCDGSDKEYCRQAFHTLSTNPRSDHAAELVSRAQRLSFEEGKEMKRAKMLNVLKEVPDDFFPTPDDFFPTPFAQPMGPAFLAPQAVVVVKEERG